MLKKFSAWLLYQRMGWKANITVAHPKKYIICLAPHTSNLDFLIGQLFARAENMTSGFLMKKEWFLLLSLLPLLFTIIFLQFTTPVWDESTKNIAFYSVFIYDIAIILVL